MGEWTREYDGDSPSRAPQEPPTREYKKNYNSINWSNKKEVEDNEDTKELNTSD